MGHHRLATPDLGRIFRGDAVSGLSEWQLLERYLERRDEVAFEALVARHGPMVLAVCRRMLINQTDVEDAFQATFLVLVRRARQLGPRDAIGPWLYGVATRVALRARCEAARRRRVEPLPPDLTAIGDERDGAADREIGAGPRPGAVSLAVEVSPSHRPVLSRGPDTRRGGPAAQVAARNRERPPVPRTRSPPGAARPPRRGTPAVGALSFVLSPDSRAAPHRELLDRTVKHRSSSPPVRPPVKSSLRRSHLLSKEY